MATLQLAPDSQAVQTSQGWTAGLPGFLTGMTVAVIPGSRWFQGLLGLRRSFPAEPGACVCSRHLKGGDAFRWRERAEIKTWVAA